MPASVSAIGSVVWPSDGAGREGRGRLTGQDEGVSLELGELAVDLDATQVGDEW